jgi:hypothetical protein
MPTPMYTHPAVGLSQPACQAFQRQPGVICPAISRSQAHPWLKNSAQYDTYLNTISIYIRPPEPFYTAFFTNRIRTERLCHYTLE